MRSRLVGGPASASLALRRPVVAFPSHFLLVVTSKAAHARSRDHHRIEAGEGERAEVAPLFRGNYLCLLHHRLSEGRSLGVSSAAVRGLLGMQTWPGSPDHSHPARAARESSVGDDASVLH